VFICGLKTVVQEPQITLMKQMAQMKRKNISVNLWFKNSCPGTADCTDETDGADEEEEEEHQCSSVVKKQLSGNRG
jgi:hypothetical protein